MQSFAFAVSLRRGRTEANRIALAACHDGPRREAYRDARRRAGITREAVWIQPASDGDVAVVYLEADDLATAFSLLETSVEPFDRWFREHVRELHGIVGLAESELVLDFDINRI